MCCPFPPCSRWRIAARMLTAAYIPHITSAIPTPTFIGEPSGSPVTLIIPPMACIMKSYPGLCDFGPVCPNPEIEQ